MHVAAGLISAVLQTLHAILILFDQSKIQDHAGLYFA